MAPYAFTFGYNPGGGYGKLAASSTQPWCPCNIVAAPSIFGTGYAIPLGAGFNLNFVGITIRGGDFAGLGDTGCAVSGYRVYFSSTNTTLAGAYAMGATQTFATPVTSSSAVSATSRNSWALTAGATTNSQGYVLVQQQWCATSSNFDFVGPVTLCTEYQVPDLTATLGPGPLVLGAMGAGCTYPLSWGDAGARDSNCNIDGSFAICPAQATYEILEATATTVLATGTNYFDCVLPLTCYYTTNRTLVFRKQNSVGSDSVAITVSVADTGCCP